MKPEPISVKELAAVKAMPTKNQRLLTLMSELGAYNALLAQKVRPLSKLIGHLDAAMVAAAWWLTEKPKKGDENSNRTKRREALFAIAREISRSLAECYGIRPLVGDFSKPDSTENYWLERIDKKHRPGFALAKHYGVWVEKKPAAGEVAEDFWTFMETVPVSQENKAWKLAQDLQLDPDIYGDEKSKKAAEEELKKIRQNIADLKLDVKQLELDARLPYVVKVEGGRLVTPDAEAFCTKKHQTHFSGLGWAIFVFAAQDLESNGRMRDTLFARSHTRGEFHHSTFLGGAPVKAAGEIVVDDQGKVAVVTNKSGHYHPSPAELLAFVKFLQAGQVFSRDAIVVIYGDFDKSLKTPAKLTMLQTVTEFLKGDKGKFVDAAEALEIVPKWAQSPQAKKKFEELTNVDLLPDGATEQAKVNGDPKWGFAAARDGTFVRINTAQFKRFDLRAGDLILDSRLAKPPEPVAKPPGINKTFAVIARRVDGKMERVELVQNVPTQ